MALVPDQKFSTFQDGGDLAVDDIIVGLRDGLNTRFTYTGELPVGIVVPITQGGTGATTAAGARTNLGLGTMATQDASAVVITGGSAALTSGSVVAAPSAGIDLTNKTYVDGLDAGNVKSVTGTANRIASTGGANPVIDISASYVGQSSITTLGTIGTGTWQGTILSPTYGGTGVNNGSSTLTLGGNHTLSGAFASTFTLTNTTTVTFPTSGTLATTSQLPVAAALTKTDDTNVTLTLAGSPATALLQATSLTLGWTGQLAASRGGTGISSLGTGVATALGASVIGSGGICLGSATAQWTPVATFATPGNLSVVYSTQKGLYSLSGNQLTATFYLSFTPTYTSSSGSFQITGLPVAANGVVTINHVGDCWTSSLTYPAGTTYIVPIITNGGSLLTLQASGSAAGVATISTTQVTSGAAVAIVGSITYVI